ncbi:MAG: hypothetical protein WBL23_08470 [Salinisphaera sp.]
MSVTTGGPRRAFLPYGRGGSIERLLWPINYSLYYMGFDVLAPQVAYGVQGAGIAYREADDFARHLAEAKHAWAERLRHIDRDRPIPFTGWGDWDDGVLAEAHPQRLLG